MFLDAEKAEPRSGEGSKSFLVLFFKKERLAVYNVIPN
jgi:hypothetical protein